MAVLAERKFNNRAGLQCPTTVHVQLTQVSWHNGNPWMERETDLGRQLVTLATASFGVQRMEWWFAIIRLNLW